MRNTSTEITQVKFMVNDLIILTGEADLTFQIKLSEQIDRFRRILNSDIYIPGACKRLAERCEAMLSHLKENTVHLPDVKGLETDFLPVFAQCTLIAEFLEETQSLSWGARRILSKDELAFKAKTFTLRIDEISCQVLIQLNMRATQTSQHYNNMMIHRASIDSTDSTLLETAEVTDLDPISIRKKEVERLRSIGRVVFLMIFVVGVIWIILQER